MSLAEFHPDKHRNNRNSPWVPIIEARFVQLWNEGRSATICANLLNSEFAGIKFTRNAMIGKANRMGLPPHDRHAGRPKVMDPLQLARRRARKLEMGRRWADNNRDKVALYHTRYREKLEVRRHAPQIEDFNIPTPQRKTIFELGPHDCRWPVGEPKSDLFFFCGAVAEESKPYCSSHCRRAYVEIRAR